MIGDVDSDDFDDLSGEGDWYLSVVIPDEIQAVARTLHEGGESYRYVGKMVNHHLSDLEGGLSGLRLYSLKHTSKPDQQGIIAVVPNVHWYEPITDVDRNVEPYRAMVRFYGVPDAPDVLDLAKQEIIKRGWDDEKIVTNLEYASPVAESIEADAQFETSSEAQAEGYYVWE